MRLLPGRLRLCTGHKYAQTQMRDIIWARRHQFRQALTCSQQLGNLALHEAELADKDVQNPAQLQAVGVGCGAVCMARKHDLHHTVQQLDAGALC